MSQRWVRFRRQTSSFPVPCSQERRGRERWCWAQWEGKRQRCVVGVCVCLSQMKDVINSFIPLQSLNLTTVITSTQVISSDFNLHIWLGLILQPLVAPIISLLPFLFPWLSPPSSIRLFSVSFSFLLVKDFLIGPSLLPYTFLYLPHTLHLSCIPVTPEQCRQLQAPSHHHAGAVSHHKRKKKKLNSVSPTHRHTRVCTYTQEAILIFPLSGCFNLTSTPDSTVYLAHISSR